MTHNARINGDRFYANGQPIPQAYFEALDTAQSKALNGDTGGSWAPSSPILLEGATPWSASLFLQVGQVVTPAGSSPPYPTIYRVTTSGTTGSTQPKWTGAVGSTILDGTVVYTIVAAPKGAYQGAALSMEGTLTLQDGARVRTPSGSGLRVTLIDSVPKRGMYRPIVTSFGLARDARGSYETTQFHSADETTTWAAGDNYILYQAMFLPVVYPGSPTSIFGAGSRIHPDAGSGGTGLDYVSSGGTTSGTVPTWPTVIGGTVVDGSVTWTAAAPTTFALICIKNGTAGSTLPVWPAIAGGTVADGTVIWQAVDAGDTTVAAAQYVASVDGMMSPRPGMHLMLPVRVHDGATYETASVTFRVGNVHTAVPSALPAARIVQVGLDGTVTPLSADLSNDAGGWCTPAPPFGGWTPSNWTGNLTIDLGAANVFYFDRSKYRYFCEFKDENGVGALGGNIAMACEMDMAVADDRFQ